MPVDFLTEDHRRKYGRYAGEPSPEQLAGYFYLDEADRSALVNRRGEHNRLGFAVQLGTVRFLGTFLAEPADVPSKVAYFLAAQIGVDPDCLKDYRDEQVRWRHAREIRALYGYRDFGAQPETFRLVRWLYTRCWLSSERPTLLFDVATAWLVDRKILLPGVTVLERLVARVRDRAAARLWKVLAGATSQEQRVRLEALLEIPEGSRVSVLDRLRKAPARVSSTSLVSALRRCEAVRALGVEGMDLSRVPPSGLKTLARHASKVWAATLMRLPAERRLATLVAFAHAFTATTLDDALDVLDLLLQQKVKEARKGGARERLRTLPDLDEASLTLWQAASVLLDESCEDAQVRSAVFALVPPDVLRQACHAVGQLARPAEEHAHEHLLHSYRGVRAFLPALLRTVPFKAAPAGRRTLEALRFLASIEGQKCPDMSVAPLEGMSRSWQRQVIGAEGEIERKPYTLWALQGLQEALRRRDVFVEPSERWGDPRAKLLRGADWEAARPHVLRTLGLSRDVHVELERLRRELDAAYLRTAANLPGNTEVCVESEDGVDSLSLSRLDRLEEPATLVELRERIKGILPRADLPEVLLEVNSWTGFCEEFTHISEEGARATDLAVSVCAVLVAEACNIGLEPLIRPDVPALTRSRLSWIQQNYIRADTLIRANARLVEAQTRIPLAREWGGGEVATADGVRFVVPVRTLNAGPNPKYFGVGRGITYYNFTSDQFTGFHGIVIPGTMRDSLFLLDGLLEQQTVLEPQEIMTDTAGYRDLVFGLFWLLGYQFSPRLADLGKRRFWRFDASSDYGPLEGVARHTLNSGLIERDWEDVLRVTGSLKTGTVSASELTRSLLSSTRPTTLARAIGELGKIPKTIHMLNYVDNEAYRRRILVYLNRNESRHKRARELCHGHRGQIRKRFREGQEDQLNALGLVLNVMVLWNTQYMEAARNHLQSTGFSVIPEDVARLSPLEHRNINVLGRYNFALPDPVARGELRPLRKPDEAEDLVDVGLM